MTDAYADVIYLSNHYSPFPLVADLPPYWVGKAHSVIVLPTDGEPTLIVDLPDWRRDLVAIEDTRFSLDLPTMTAAVLQERKLDDGKLGLVGVNAMHASPYIRMLEHLPRADIEIVDDLIEGVRVLKSARELDLIRESADAGNAVIGAIMEAAMKPGTTEAEAIAAGYAIGVSRGAAMYDAATASGPNCDYYAFGRLPSWTTRRLEPGEFFHIDCYGVLNGYLWDFTRTCVVGRHATRAQIEVLDGLVDAVEKGIAAVRPGVHADELYATVRGVLAHHGLVGESDETTCGGRDSAAGAALLSFPCHGHSFGLSWESPWFVPGNSMTIQAGMCIAIEVMAGRSGVGSGKFEQDMIVHEDHVEILSTLPKYYADSRSGMPS
jgi:Xaa-Pro aminopeptidase